MLELMIPLKKVAAALIVLTLAVTTLAAQEKTDLWTAVKQGDVEAVEEYLAAGGDPNARSADSGTLLMWAAILGEAEIAHRLIQAGADIHARNRDGSTALHAAAFMGEYETAKLLIEAGAQVDAKNHRGETPADSLKADWPTTQFIAGLLQIKADKEKIEAGRARVNELLRDAQRNPAKPKSKLSEVAGIVIPAVVLLLGVAIWIGLVRRYGERQVVPGESGATALPASVPAVRRHDIDWLRTLAMGMLILYHVVVSFQPWGGILLFPQNEESLGWLWTIMSLVNIWRIPIVFMISGMGVRFAMERRDWKQLLKDRTVRILVPFIFGFFFICPINLYIGLRYYGKQVAYIPNPGHLWFLGNIYIYVLLFLPLLTYFWSRPDNLIFRTLSGLLRRPWLILTAALPLMLEAWLVNPTDFPNYAMTPHGFWLGMVCFLTGFVFISLRDAFWKAVAGIRWPALIVAFLLYLARLSVYHLQGVPNALIAFESMCWMLAIFGHGSVYLNKPSAGLRYLSRAVYPVYIVHLPVQFGIAYYLLPLTLPAILKLILLTAGTLGVSLLMYEGSLRRIRWIRPLFGMKFQPK